MHVIIIYYTYVCTGTACEVEQKEMLLQCCGESVSSETLIVHRSAYVADICMYCIAQIVGKLGEIT